MTKQDISVGSITRKSFLWARKMLKIESLSVRCRQTGWAKSVKLIFFFLRYMCRWCSFRENNYESLLYAVHTVCMLFLITLYINTEMYDMMHCGWRKWTLFMLCVQDLNIQYTALWVHTCTNISVWICIHFCTIKRVTNIYWFI